MKASNALCKIDQAVACVLLDGEWRSPHLSLNDALMLQDSFNGFANLLGARLRRGQGAKGPGGQTTGSQG